MAMIDGSGSLFAALGLLRTGIVWCSLAGAASFLYELASLALIIGVREMRQPIKKKHQKVDDVNDDDEDDGKVMASTNISRHLKEVRN